MNNHNEDSKNEVSVTSITLDSSSEHTHTGEEGFNFDHLPLFFDAATPPLSQPEELKEVSLQEILAKDVLAENHLSDTLTEISLHQKTGIHQSVGMDIDQVNLDKAQSSPLTEHDSTSECHGHVANENVADFDALDIDALPVGFASAPHPPVEAKDDLPAIPGPLTMDAPIPTYPDAEVSDFGMVSEEFTLSDYVAGESGMSVEFDEVADLSSFVVEEHPSKNEHDK